MSVVVVIAVEVEVVTNVALAGVTVEVGVYTLVTFVVNHKVNEKVLVGTLEGFLLVTLV